MKIVVGVDTQGLYESAINILTRAQLSEMELHLVHVIENLFAFNPIPYPGPAFETAQVLEKIEKSSKELVEKACQELKQKNIQAKAVILRGHPVDQISHYAEEIAADMIATGSEKKGTLGSLFFGSVTRGLVIGAPKSILIAKGEISDSGKLKAVLATDHSDYNAKAVKQLIKIAPQGFEKITVLTVYDKPPKGFAMFEYDAPELTDEAVQSMEQELHNRNNKIIESLSPLGAECESRVQMGDTNQVLHNVMEETGSDLLITAAQGHGFVERVTVGSITFHQVVSEPYSVWVIRV